MTLAAQGELETDRLTNHFTAMGNEDLHIDEESGQFGAGSVVVSWGTESSNGSSKRYADGIERWAALTGKRETRRLTTGTKVEGGQGDGPRRCPLNQGFPGVPRRTAPKDG